MPIFLSFSGHGGVERMVLNLAQAFTTRGIGVELLAVKLEGGHAAAIPAGVSLIDLHARHTLTSIASLARYLRTRRPPALLAAKDRAIRAAVIARWLAGTNTRIVGRLGTTVSAALEGRGRLKRWLWYTGMRLFYPHVDRIVAVSQGVADDVRAITGLAQERLVVIRNPVVTPMLHTHAARPSGHPWLDEDTIPVVVGAGRLTRQKDFPMLLRAFARVRRTQPCRLVILGEGRGRAALEALARELGVAEDVALPGFVANPYSFMARAKLFVLSSVWEGSPNTLTEAMALGVPVAATDCPSGPRELLAGGRYGKLVPVGDAEALAAAMIETLAHPLPAETLKDAVREHNADDAARRYLEALGMAPNAASSSRASDGRVTSS